MSQVTDKWAQILEELSHSSDMTTVSFSTWIQPLSVYKVSADTVYIMIPANMGEFGLDYIERKYSFQLIAAIKEVTGRDYQVSFVLPDQTGDIDHKTEDKPASSNPVLAGLNPKYSFDTFVVGNNNKFAHAASLAVAENPGVTYNPLFLYGGVGLGKTHLMNSIARYIAETRPELNILYVTSEEFTNEVIEAIRNGSNTAISSFREKYRNIDVLLIDDIQFIIGKESTQEEFFHTFNALHSAHKQIVLSSDRPPKDMDILEERIRSRFEWGLMADIQSPDYETRMAILRKKQEADHSKVSPDVLDYIAQNVRSNIRELEGSLNKVIALATLEGREVTMDLARKALADIISPEEKTTITPDYIIDIVADQFDITAADIKSSKKAKKYSYPRQIAMYLCRTLTDNNLQSIADSVGAKNHTTVMYAINKIENEYTTNKETKQTIDLLKKKINPQV